MGCLLAACLLLQDPSTDELIRRLSSDDPAVRSESGESLIRRGRDALQQIRHALESASDPEVRAQLERIARKIEHNEALKEVSQRFSEGFRKAAPALLDSLAEPTPQAIREAIAATSGVKIEQDERIGTYAVPVKKMAAATRSDRTEVLRLALQKLPPRGDSAEWKLVKAAFTEATLGDAPAALFDEALPHLENGDERFVRALGCIVGAVRHPKHLPALIKLLDAPSAEVQESAAFALQAFSPGEHAEEIVKRLDRKPLCTYLLRTLSNAGDARFAKVIRSFADNDDAGVQAEALDALACLDPKAYDTEVLKRLRSGDYNAIHPARRSRDPQIILELRRIVLEGSNAFNASQALYVLEAIRPEDIEDVIERALGRDSVRAVAVQCAAVVGGDRVVKALTELLRSGSERDRASAALALAELKVGGHESEIRPLLDSKDANVRSSGILALAKLKDKEGLEKLPELLEDPSDLIQAEALYALDRLGVPGQEEKIRAKLKSQSSMVKQNALYALAARRDKACVAVLVEMLSGAEREAVSPLGPLALLAKPELFRILAETALRLPDRSDLTVEQMLGPMCEALKKEGVEVRVDLPEFLQKTRFQSVHHFLYTVTRPLGLLGFLRTERIAGWFVDERGLHICAPDAAAEYWLSWARKR